MNRRNLELAAAVAILVLAGALAAATALGIPGSEWVSVNVDPGGFPDVHPTAPVKQ